LQQAPRPFALAKVVLFFVTSKKNGIFFISTHLKLTN
jgi:hypothetical protein